MLVEKDGVTVYDERRATPGFTLFWPLGTNIVHLMNMQGEMVHEWNMPGIPGNYAYLLPNGNLLAAVRTTEQVKGLAAKGGHLVEMDWDGNILWEHVNHLQHHDFRRLANGNTVYLHWELMSEERAALVPGGIEGSEHEEGIFGDVVHEINPAGETVWEWHTATDIEDMDKYPICPVEPRREWAHANAICPLENGDYMISFRQNHLIATIDRNTKRFSWEMCDWILGHQHDVQMLDNGNVLVFANGAHAPYHGPHEGSRIFEIDPNKDNEIVWTYEGSPPYTFESSYISGAQRLGSGNTLICEGKWGRLFEVTPDGDIVWNYNSPFKGDDKPYYPGRAIFRCYRYAEDSTEISGRVKN